MKKITVHTISKDYDIYIGDVISKLEQYLDKTKPILIITDDNVKNYHLDTLLKEIETEYYLFSLGEIPEENKNLATYEACITECSNNFLDRYLTVIAFGGGAVSDFSAFFASTYKRGVKLINLPTTLLAHDSSVGGKTALNVNGVKNVIGSFYQPEVILYHLEFLKTLQEEDILSGFGEVFKHDLLADQYILNELLDENRLLREVIMEKQLLEEILYRCILVKKVFVEMDLYDNLGKRQFLNFGHTLGHAIEILYSISHGEAVAFGMCFDLYLSDNLYFKSFYQLLINWGYFKEIPIFNLEDMIQIMKNDKKNANHLLKFIGLKTVGQPYEINLTITEFKLKYAEFLLELR